jgi:hypothetical protein
VLGILDFDETGSGIITSRSANGYGSFDRRFFSANISTSGVGDFYPNAMPINGNHGAMSGPGATSSP